MRRGDTVGTIELWERLWHSSRHPQALAALILCEAVERPTTHAPSDDLEKATSRAFIEWYRKLINAGAKTVIGRLNE